MFRPIHALLIALCAFGLSPALVAETLSVPEEQPEQQKETFSIILPGRGMTMEQVQQQFGEPVEKFAGVGQPPITRWVYKTFTVYFENNYVIHAVFQSPQE